MLALAMRSDNSSLHVIVNCSGEVVNGAGFRRRHVVGARLGRFHGPWLWCGAVPAAACRQRRTRRTARRQPYRRHPRLGDAAAASPSPTGPRAATAAITPASPVAASTPADDHAARRRLHPESLAATSAARTRTRTAAAAAAAAAGQVNGRHALVCDVSRSVCTRSVAVATRSHPEVVGDMSRVTLNFDLSKIPFVRF